MLSSMARSKCMTILQGLPLTGGHSRPAQCFIEALLIDEEPADQVWEAWDKGEID